MEADGPRFQNTHCREDCAKRHVQTEKKGRKLVQTRLSATGGVCWCGVEV